MKENRYYVYLHRNLQGQVFYVGKGTRNRCLQSCNRSKTWKEIAINGWVYQIVKSDLTNEEALLLERDLIAIYKSHIVNRVSSQVVKEVDNFIFKDTFYYDSTSPSGLRWKVPKYKFVKGDVAGNEMYSNGKPRGWRVMLNKKAYYVHRIIWALINGSVDRSMVIDHLDGNPQNNHIDNLQIKTHASNMLNKGHKSSSTGITGVTERIGRKGITYFRVSWVDENGRQCFKTFSTNKYGKEEAFKLAFKVREDKIRKLKELGFDYTDRHIATRNK